MSKYRYSYLRGTAEIRPLYSSSTFSQFKDQGNKEQKRLQFALFIGQLDDNKLHFLEGTLRYSSLGKFASDEQQEKHEVMCSQAWDDALLCRMEMKRRWDLDS